MNIYSCVDSINIEKIYVLFFSVYKNTNKFNDLKFHIITDSNNIKEVPKILKKNLKIKTIKFSKKWEETLINFNKYFYNKSSWCKSDMNFARFFIFELFPEIDRVIYLDWDMIVQKDIFGLKEFYEKEEPIVANMLNNWNVKENIINEGVRISKYKLSEFEKEFELDNLFAKKSFNSGFFIVSKDTFNLINLNILIVKLIDKQVENNMFKFGTQVIMNILFQNPIFIDYRWNTSNISEDNFILHWCGHKKPWVSNDKIWLKYYNELNFKPEKDKDLQNKKLNNKVLIYLKNS